MFKLSKTIKIEIYYYQIKSPSLHQLEGEYKRHNNDAI